MLGGVVNFLWRRTTATVARSSGASPQASNRSRAQGKTRDRTATVAGLAPRPAAKKTFV